MSAKHGVRECRGHWHVTSADGEFDLAGYCKDEAAARELAAEYDAEDACLTAPTPLDYNMLNSENQAPTAPTPSGASAAVPLSAEERILMHRAFLRVVTPWKERGVKWWLEPEYVDAMFDAIAVPLLAARRGEHALRAELDWISREMPRESFHAGGEGYLAFANRLKTRALAALAATPEEK